MMADKKEIDINGVKYSIKKANASSHASNFTINGWCYVFHQYGKIFYPNEP